MSESDAGSANRQHWDELARLHGDLGSQGGSDYYDVTALRAGRSSLTTLERRGVERAVGDVTGLRVLHHQCHIGFDAISLARQGAVVTGLDFSPASLEEGRRLAEACGVDVTWVEADATDPPASLDGSFDLVYSTMGILCWIGDVAAWMRGVQRVLRPGGRLLLIDLHPLFLMVDQAQPLQLDFPYQSDGAVVLDEVGTYAAAGTEVASTRTIEHAHGLGRIVSAAIGAGLVVTHLGEDFETDIDPRGSVLTQEEDGLFRLRVDGQLLPTTYTLVAERPA